MALPQPAYSFLVQQVSDQREQIGKQHAKAGTLISLEVAALAFIIRDLLANSNVANSNVALFVPVGGLILSILLLALLFALRADERIWPVKPLGSPCGRPPHFYDSLQGKTDTEANAVLATAMLRIIDANDKILWWCSKSFVLAVHILGASFVTMFVLIVWRTPLSGFASGAVAFLCLWGGSWVIRHRCMGLP